MNSFGTTIGPIIVSILLFGSAKVSGGEDTDISKINVLYLTLVGLFLAAAGIFAATKMPKGTEDDQFESSPKQHAPCWALR